MLSAAGLLACMAINVCVVYAAGKHQLMQTLLAQLIQHSMYSLNNTPCTAPANTDSTAYTLLLVWLIQSFLRRDVQDAFATADDDMPAVQPAGRTLSSQKSKKSQRDPSLQHAEQILAAGSDALKMQQQ